MKPVGILVRAATPPQQALTAASKTFRVADTARALLPEIESGETFAAAGAARWWSIDLEAEDPGTSATFEVDEQERGIGAVWDLCHDLVASDPAIEFAEPDFEQSFIDPALLDGERLAGAGSGGGEVPDMMWYRDAGQYDALSAPSSKRVRVAHLDTGYLPGYDVLPERLRTDLAVNTIDGEDPHDARDVTPQGFSTQAGHGTATMALLASGFKVDGRKVGVAPFVEVVPFRVANRVYHLRTSSIARAFDEVHRLNGASGTTIHVVTMSMGGWPSEAWATAVNQVYEDGTVIVTAAGNNINGAPTYELVYPARFERVIAATGVMANGKPYDDLGLGEMTGNYGPPSAMDSAIAAYTPDVPWISLDTPKGVTGGGGGTSSATPQVAAAAAWWIRKHRATYDAYKQGWQKVEAVRRALFDSADASSRFCAEHFGRGTLKAADALAVEPAAASSLKKSPEASARFSLWHLLPDLFGIAGPADGRQRMIDLEAQQLMMSAQMSAEYDLLTEFRALDDLERMKGDALNALRDRLGMLGAERVSVGPQLAGFLTRFVCLLVADPEGDRRDQRDRFTLLADLVAAQEQLPGEPIAFDGLVREFLNSGGRSDVARGAALVALRKEIERLLAGEIFDALREHPLASRRLRGALGAGAEKPSNIDAVDEVGAWRAFQIEFARRGVEPDYPVTRRLRVYAIDPSMEAQISTFHLTEATLRVPWERRLAPGPVGEYLEVVDIDPASGAAYAPVDLDDHRILSESGLQPSETNPQFHQQMVYAVAMRTIEHFENALGRVALWAPRQMPGDRRGAFVRRLRIHPHGIRQKNAYYSIQKKALLFGYFRNDEPGGEAANELGTTIFTCLSHDIIAHETSHALLDGLHSAFAEPTSPDVMAFHEAFADIVALFQHFTMPEVLRDQIKRSGGDLRSRNLLAMLAVQFGQALGGVALRDYIGTFEPGEAGSSPVWRRREPSRSDLAKATEAHERGAVMVGAVFDAFLDVYELRTRDDVLLATGGTGVLGKGALPPVLVDRLASEAAMLAGHFLTLCIRALDYCPPLDISFGDYLRALVTAEKDLMPEDEKSLRVALISAFRERGIFPSDVTNLTVDALLWQPPPYPIPLAKAQALLGRLTLTWSRDTDRREVFNSSNRNADIVEEWLLAGNLDQKYLAMLGLRPVGSTSTISGVPGTIGPLRVHSVRPAIRTTPDGRVRTDIVVEITQSWITAGQSRVEYKGGCTLLIDPGTGEVRYFIRKRVANPRRVDQQMGFMRQEADRRLSCNTSSDGLAGRAAANAAAAEPFALMHGALT